MSHGNRRIDARIHKLLFGDRIAMAKGVPFYSSDPGDSRDLLKKMVEILPCNDIHIEHHEGEGWAVSTCYDTDGWKGWVNAPTLEMAIAKAALKMNLSQKKKS